MEDLIVKVPKHIREIVELSTEQKDQLKKDVRTESKQKEQQIINLLQILDELNINLADVVTAFSNAVDTDVD